MGTTHQNLPWGGGGATGLTQRLEGTVCAVAYDSDLVVAGEPRTVNLSGVNLGVVSFQVTSVDTAGGEWPAVTIQILNARDACAGVVAAFADAPDVP